MNKMDVTVILPANSHSELLPVCLSHLEVQSYPAARFEVLLLDEGDSETDMELVKRYIAASPIRIEIIQRSTAGPIHARNQAILRAQGQWLLFLDKDLLAGPHWVEQHVRAQEKRGGHAVIVGNVTRHPQLNVPVPARMQCHKTIGADANESLAPFQAWRLFNLSVPRKVVVEAGAFDTEFPVSCFEDIELAWRLHQRGMQGHFIPEAHAYTWQLMTLNSERQHYYACGYSWPVLQRKIPENALGDFHHLCNNPLKWTLDRALFPIYLRLCDLFHYDTALAKFLWRRIVAYEIHKGYCDATNHLPPDFS